MTICHVTASGQRNTLILPRVAALNHLLRHPEDTIGPCNTVDVAVDATPTTVQRTTKKKPAPPTKEEPT